MKRALSLLCCLVFCHISIAQGSFPPQAGEAGTTAIHKDSVCFRDWAISCVVQRGYLRIDQPDSGYVSSGSELYATGKANAPLTISLGDGGTATLQFTAAIYNGPGADFAVFENGFGSGDQAFLELAFVEVSSDGEHFFRFPAFSEVPTDQQKGTFDNTDASYLHNLAGKYIAGYGVPFDLDDVPDTSLLNKQSVTHVRLVDVVGNIDAAYATYDALGNPINDPWPTSFPQGGFDLDAIGVINSNIPLNIDAPKESLRAFNGMYFDLLGRPVHSPQHNQVIVVNGKKALFSID